MNLKRMGIFIIIAFVACFPTSVLAKTYANVICPDNSDPLNVRNAIGGSIITAVPCNGTVEVLDENAGSNSSCNKWYKVIYNGYTGYACGDYMAIVDDGTPTSTISDNVYIRDNYSKPVAGDGTIMCYEDTTDLSLRRTPGGLTTGTKVKCGEVITINSVSEASGTCKYYYNITDSKGNSGYVCGYYVNTTKLSETANKYYNTTEKLDDYYALLREKGFPESYLPYLAEIHARHPNWVFNAEAINLDFDDVVKGESYYGRNLLEMNAFSQNYFSMDINNYSIINDQFYSYSTESGYTSASSEAIAYFLDPRNYLNEKYVFAFEGLDFNETQDAMVVQSILANQTFWPVVYQGFDSNVYDDIVLATRAVGISAAHVASRISQEITGISTTDPRLGGTFNYNSQDYSGYYNFFNIGVYGENKIVNGMVYAMNHGWNTPYNCIYGGAEFLYDGYIGVNQDTMYYQKFDVSTTDGNYTHQYMQNLAAPVQETNKSYTTYVSKAPDYLDTAIVFTIPVYDNMPDYAVTSPSVGNPNNYLNNITINGQTIEGFNYSDFEYDITLEAGTTSIEIGASTINANASVSGTGKIDITSNEMTKELVVTSESGRTRTYTLNITRTESEEVVDISTILNNTGIKYNDNYMYGIYENTDISSLINNVKEVSPLANVEIKETNGEVKTSGIFKTGDIVTISNGVDSVELEILIYGDINGDGVIDKLDYLAVLRHYYGYASLSDVYKEAADANKDDVIDKLDYLAILRDYYGYATIEQ